MNFFVLTLLDLAITPASLSISPYMISSPLYSIDSLISSTISSTLVAFRTGSFKTIAINAKIKQIIPIS